MANWNCMKNICCVSIILCVIFYNALTRPLVMVHTLICKHEQSHENIMESTQIMLDDQVQLLQNLIEKYLKELIRQQVTLAESNDVVGRSIMDNSKKILHQHYSRLLDLKQNFEEKLLMTNTVVAESTGNNDLNCTFIENVDSKLVQLPILSSVNYINRNTLNKLRYSCNEKYLAPTYDEKSGTYKAGGFIREKCQRKPINMSVSIIFDRPLVFLGSRFLLNETTTIVSKIYKDVYILLENSFCLSGAIATNNWPKNVHINCIYKRESYGFWMNSIITKNITSTFVIIAPHASDFNNNWLNVERMLHVHEITGADVIGSATRNIHDGRWNIGCYQSLLKLYKLIYTPGYKTSMNECLHCDFLSGAFLSAVDTMKTVQFSTIFVEGLYEDFFLRLKELKKTVLACPDVMISMYNHQRIIETRFQSFAKFWDLSVIKHFTGKTFRFKCPTSHGELVKKCRVEKGVAIPLCCLGLLYQGLKFLFTICHKAKLKCELREGSLLGAVKFSDLLPWEQDADVSVPSKEFQILTRNYTKKFRDENYEIIVDEEVKCCTKDNSSYGGVAHVRVYHWSIQIYGVSKPPTNKRLTLVNFKELLIGAPENPGLYARNKYGPGIYKHAEHWMKTGKETGWERYEAGEFEKCPRPGHHFCLDEYSADGNLQFIGG